MRQFIAAAAIAVVFVGGAFVIPTSYERPAPMPSQPSVHASILAAFSPPPDNENNTSAPVSTRPFIAAAAPPAPTPAHQHAPAALQTIGQGESVAGQTPGDVQAGRQVYRKCQACHSLEPEKN